VTDISVSTPDDSPNEEIAEAIEQVAEQTQSFEIGVLVGRIDSLEEKVQYHDDLISLHSHDGLASQDESQAMVMETEDRLVAKIQSLVDRAEDVIEENEESEVEEMPEVAESNEEVAEQVEEETTDEPPKSRAKRTPLAERYYKSSRL